MWTVAETCPGICSGREEFNNGGLERVWPDPPEEFQKGPEFGEVAWRWIDEKGFEWCPFCKRPKRVQLVECPDCNRFFEGPKPNFRIDYECDDCG